VERVVSNALALAWHRLSEKAIHLCFPDSKFSRKVVPHFLTETYRFTSLALTARVHAKPGAPPQVF